MLRRISLLGLLLVAGPAGACDYAGPYAHRYAYNGAATWVDGPGGDCTLHAALNDAGGRVAGAVAHYRRHVPLTTVRYSFTFDATHLPLTSLFDGARLFTASAAVPVTAPPHYTMSAFASVRIIGPAATPKLGIIAGDAPQPRAASVDLTGLVHTVRLELNTATPTTTGGVRYWVDADFSAPPTGVLDNFGAGLDNAGFGGVIGATIGLGGLSPGLRTRGATYVDYSAIGSTDDQLFWDSFDADAQ